MAKTTKIIHRLADGTLATRDSTRTYTYVIVGEFAEAVSVAGKMVGPGLAVVGYSNSPSWSPWARQYGRRSLCALKVENINNGERV